MDPEKPVDPDKAAVQEIFPAAKPQMRMAVAKETPRVPMRGMPLKYDQEETTSVQTGVTQRSPGHEDDDDQPPPEVKIDTDMLRRVTECIRNVSSSNPNLNPKCSIYTAPLDIREFDPEAYTPKVVSIGPYHYRNPFSGVVTTADPYKDMQLYKMRCLRKFISQHGHLQEPDRTNTLVHRCLVALKKHGERIKSYYSRPITTSSSTSSTDDELASYYCRPFSVTCLTDDDLAFVMLLDGCFILDLLLLEDNKQKQLSKEKHVPMSKDKYVPGRIWIWTLVNYDLLLLENQIPFFVVSELRDILGTVDDKKVDLVQAALYLFKDISPSIDPKDKKEGLVERVRRCLFQKNQDTQSGHCSTTPDKVHHLLHLFYASLFPDPSSVLCPTPPSTWEPSATELNPETEIWIPSATELNTKFGLKFDKNKKAKSFLDVGFCREGITRRGVMKIPAITIDDPSKDLFRNLIAFEQCYPHTNCHVTVYTSLMDCIMRTESDVRLLHLEGVLINRMSADQEITHFFSQLNRGIHITRNRFYLGKLFNDMNSYQTDKCNKCWAEFKLTYCGNSWAVFAGVVSVIFFVLTIVQTLYTIYPYYNPRD